MAWDAYMEVEGVTGESQREGHEGQVELKSFALGGNNVSSVGSGKGGGTGTVSLSDFQITKLTDATSAEFFQHMCDGEHFPTATVTLYKSGGSGGPLDYLVYKFEEVYVTSINWSGAEGGDSVPYESVSFAYGKIEITYAEQNPDGTRGGDHVGSWDVRTRRP
jgi:type VI secretion system secreted protein Hcp